MAAPKRPKHQSAYKKTKIKLPKKNTATNTKAYLECIAAENTPLTAAAVAEREQIPLEILGDMCAFVKEYAKDYNLQNALVRTSSQHLDKSSLHHPVVQLLLHEYIRSQPLETVVSPSQIVAQLWVEATRDDDPTNSANRIKALQELAKIQQLYNPVTNILQQNQMNVMTVPLAQNMDEWEQQSTKQQKQLKDKIVDA